MMMGTRRSVAVACCPPSQPPRPTAACRRQNRCHRRQLTMGWAIWRAGVPLLLLCWGLLLLCPQRWPLLQSVLRNYCEEKTAGPHGRPLRLGGPNLLVPTSAPFVQKQRRIPKEQRQLVRERKPVGLAAGARRNQCTLAGLGGRCGCLLLLLLGWTAARSGRRRSTARGVAIEVLLRLLPMPLPKH